jgi:hypothetical protein
VAVEVLSKMVVLVLMEAPLVEETTMESTLLTPL